MRQLHTHPGIASARAFLRIARLPGVWRLPASWGDLTLGGSLGLLDMAADLGLPSVLRRGLCAGLVPSHRTHVLAWRSRSAGCLALLAGHESPLPKYPWADRQLHQDMLAVIARQQARSLRTGLDHHEAAQGSVDRF